jgi:hypothetical protein
MTRARCGGSSSESSIEVASFELPVASEDTGSNWQLATDNWQSIEVASFELPVASEDTGSNWQLTTGNWQSIEVAGLSCQLPVKTPAATGN